jgi:hypothetical protein
MTYFKSKLWAAERFLSSHGERPFIKILKEKLSNTFQSLKRKEHQRVQEETDQISIASDILQISEFNFFRLAYSQWFGREIPVSRLEHIFAEYVFKEIVPYWVRHLSRRVMKKLDQGILDPSEFHVILPKGSRKLRIEGYIYTVIILIITILLCIGAVHSMSY